MKLIIEIDEQHFELLQMAVMNGMGYNAQKIIAQGIPLEQVLEQIRAEIETKYGQYDICEYFEDYDYEENDISEYRLIGDIADILQIIDKYRK